MNPGSAVALQPDRRVLVGEVGGATVLFHVGDRRLHVLNPTAGAVWSELDPDGDVTQLARRLGERFGVTADAVLADVERLLEQLVTDGLLAPSGDADPATATGVADRPSSPGDAGTGSVTAPSSGSYAALDARLGIVCDDAEIVSVLDAVLCPLAVAEPPTGALRIERIAENGWTVVVDGGNPVRVGSRLAATLRALAEVNDLAVASVPSDLVFHAGAVCGDEGAVLLPAPSNHGKSTLTAALVRSGLRYLTDEAAAVAEGPVVRPFAKAIALDPGSYPLFPGLAPSTHDRGSGGASDLGAALTDREWHVPASRVGRVAGDADNRLVRVIVCPHWRAGAATRLHRLDPVEALHELLGQAFDFTTGGQPVFDRLVGLVGTVPVYRLGYGDLDDAVGVITALLREPASVGSGPRRSGSRQSGSRRTRRRSPAGI